MTTPMQRKDFSPSEAVAIGRLIEERHRAKIAEVRPMQARKAGLARHGISDVSNQDPAAIGKTGAVTARAVELSATDAPDTGRATGHGGGRVRR